LARDILATTLDACDNPVNQEASMTLLSFAFVCLLSPAALFPGATDLPDVPGVAAVRVPAELLAPGAPRVIELSAPLAARSLGLWWRAAPGTTLEGALVELLDAAGRTLAAEPVLENHDLDAAITGSDRPARDLVVSGLVHAHEGTAARARLWLPAQAQLDELVAVWIEPGLPLAPAAPEVGTADGSYPKPPVNTRASWGALAPTCSFSYCSVTHIAIHHSASTGDYASTSLATCKANVKAIQQYHMVTNGWCDIGYNYLVCKHGDLFEGRAGGDDVNGAHDSCNCGSLGVCSMGYHHTPYNNAVTSATLASLAELGAWKCAQKNINPQGSAYYAACGSTESTIYGHRDVSATACPGDLLYAQLGNLKNSIQSKLNGGGGCAAGEIKDCNGNCAPANWVGDGVCDNGAYTHNGVPIYFNCASFGNDGGDCGGPACPSGQVKDCNGNCCPASWVGDGYCDNGAYTYNGVPIYLNCAAFGNDGGDCAGGAGGVLKGVLHNAALGTGAPIAGGTVALSSGSFVVTGANGYYEFSLPAGTYGLAATAPGYLFATSSETVTSGEVWESLGLSASSAIPQHTLTVLSGTSFNTTYKSDPFAPVYLAYNVAPGIPLASLGAPGTIWPSLANLQVLYLGTAPSSGTLSINLQVNGVPVGTTLHLQGYVLKAGAAKLTNGSAFRVQ
jgi:hypothetical protein